jgi:hypothetical protein
MPISSASAEKILLKMVISRATDIALFELAPGFKPGRKGAKGKGGKGKAAVVNFLPFPFTLFPFPFSPCL